MTLHVLHHNHLIRFAALVLLLVPVISFAGSPDIGIVNDALRFSKTPIIAGAEVIIYVTVRNNAAEDTRGFVSFLIDGNELGVAPISLKSGGVEEEVWHLWTAAAGQHIVSAIAHLESGVDNNTRDNRVDKSVFVDRDSDGDGVLDRDDSDDDNDGIPDSVETQHGLDPQNPRDASEDPDGDGISNREEISRGLNPRSADTDGDGSRDGDDAFPLDPKRQRVTPAPTPTPASSSGGGGSATTSQKPPAPSPAARQVVAPEQREVQTRTEAAPATPQAITPPTPTPAAETMQPDRKAPQPLWRRFFSGSVGKVRSARTVASDFSRERVASARAGLASIERVLMMVIGAALVIVGFVFWLSRSSRVDEEDWDE